ncbi:hypothetical protein [Pseudonocardia asaccharolytica]|uniref:hypothetical protein n=1 Tax=Pseudonocardia asaccharolytica TaxID=54010 RepID=UPI0011BDD6A8|nr:hypothetical protein [Pseudonocardia asaccharolytica]
MAPPISEDLTLHQLLGYLLLIISAILGLRVLAQVYRGPTSETGASRTGIDSPAGGDRRIGV